MASSLQYLPDGNYKTKDNDENYKPVERMEFLHKVLRGACRSDWRQLITRGWGVDDAAQRDTRAGGLVK